MPRTSAHLLPLTLAAGLLLVHTHSTLAEAPYAVEWIRQLGTTGVDWGRAVAVDGSGNAFISGTTTGQLAGPHAGISDAFVIKYDASGTALWAEQIGSSHSDDSYGVAVDGSGNVFVSGSTLGSLDGPSAGSRDIYLAKLSSSGQTLWTRQHGTADFDEAYSVAVDGFGNAYVTGTYSVPTTGVSEPLLVKYDPSGILLWSQHIDTNPFTESGDGVAVDGAGNVYITGSVITYEAEETPDNPDPSNADALLTKLDSSGNLLWTQQIGSSSHEYSNAVALDSFDNVFIAGHTKGSYGEPNAYDQDAFLIKLDSSGNTLWSRQLESSSYEYCYSVAVDGYGNAFIAGSTTGDLGGPNAGRSDAYVAKFDGFGNVLWTLQFGTTRSDDARSVAVDDSGNVYIAGDTFGSFGGPNAGSFDMFLLKLSAPDHPTGDVNFDGTVNALDLSILSSNWLQTMPGGPAVGDINTDGTVNALDLSLLAGNWLVGSSDGDVSFDHSLASIGLIGIPEPATAILLCAGGAIMLRRRR